MSAKNIDKYNRFRSITVAFRVSPEEQKELNRAIALSGLPKQEYCYRKCMEREVVVQPSPRVYKALKTQMEFILNELQRIDVGGSIEPELLDPRLQKRLFQMFGAEETNNLYFATQCKTLNEGLDEQVKGFMEEHSDTGLIIIDTLKRVREAGGADYSYASDYDIVARLKSLADSYNVTMLIVHHTRKQKAEDIFDMISGTNGLMGAADGAFVLSKEKRTSNNATLDVAGRDQQDMKIHLVRDTEKLIWNFEKSETELWKEPPEPLLEKIATTLLSESKVWEVTASELCEILGEDVKPNVLSLRLSINANRLLKDYGIHYKASRTHNGRKLSLMK